LLAAIFLAAGLIGSAGWLVATRAAPDSKPNVDSPAKGETVKNDTGPAKSADGRLEFQIVPVKQAYLPGEPILIKFTFKNVSNDTLGLWRRNNSWGYGAYTFEVTRPDGSRSIMAPPERRAWDKNVPGAHFLKAGESFALDLELNEMVESEGDKRTPL